jgi:hypothetical protein
LGSLHFPVAFFLTANVGDSSDDGLDNDFQDPITGRQVASLEPSSQV